jgi:hypothetical protein
MGGTMTVVAVIIRRYFADPAIVAFVREFAVYLIQPSEGLAGARWKAGPLRVL